MRVDWCVSSWFRIKNTHSLTLSECVCVCCLRLNQVSNLPMRDLCVGCSVRSPGVVRRVGGLCPGGVRCGVSL